MEKLSSIRKKVEAIPEDIIIEFLLRLPVKTLLRFKSVCKTWYNLIKSHTFKSMHHNFGTQSQLLICTNEELIEEEGFNHVFSFRSNDKLTSVLSPDLEIPANRDRRVLVAGSCNGIVCYFDCSSTIFLSNPTTREFKKLPPNSFQLGIMGFRFEQLGVSFGFDSSNIYDFKVIRIFCAVGTHKETRAEMFTLSSNTWRPLDWGLNNTLVFLGFGLFCANSFQFIMHDPHVERIIIVCCDIRTGRFKTMEFPQKPKDGYGSFKMLMVFKGCLASVYTFPRWNSEEKPIEIWVMKDYGVIESWTKLYTIGPLLALPLCFWMDEHDLLLVHFKTKKLVSYHLSTLDVESIEIFGYMFYSQVVVHKETLVSIT